MVSPSKKYFYKHVGIVSFDVGERLPLGGHASFGDLLVATKLSQQHLATSTAVALPVCAACTKLDGQLCKEHSVLKSLEDLREQLRTAVSLDDLKHCQAGGVCDFPHSAAMSQHRKKEKENLKRVVNSYCRNLRTLFRTKFK